MTRPSVFFLVLAVMLGLGATASALQVKEVRWGFDGKVVSGKFNLLSVLVDEPGPSAFDGEIALAETQGAEATIGAPQIQRVFVTPGTQRWLQYTPFIGRGEKWRLRWGKKESFDIDAPSSDAPATVLLLDPSSPFASRAQLRAFSEDLFPTSVTATDGLDQVVLDHLPRWDAPRREAFLDWLRRGGVVHILKGADGHPIFEGELSVLNSAAPKHRVGAGTVVRHDITPLECNSDFLGKAGFPLRGNIAETAGNYPVIHDFDQTLLQKLAGMTKPDVQWWLLYLLTIGYLVVIGPVHYRWSRSVDYRVAILGFLGVVAAFAIAFIFAGSRGAGEIQTVHTVAIARSLGEKRWDVMQWSSAFATTGDKYQLTHAAPVNVYAVPSEAESVNGYVLNGKGGYLEVDMPLYSSRPFLHRGVMTGPAAAIKVAEWKRDRVVLKCESDLERGAMECRARRGDFMLPLEKNGAGWVWDEKIRAAMRMDIFFDRHQLQLLERGGSFDPKQIFTPLAASFFGDVNGLSGRISARPLPEEQMQLLLFAKAPESFSMQGKGFHGERGWVLYIVDLFRPGT